MKPPPLLLRFAQSGYTLILLAVVLLTIWGLAELHARQRMLMPALLRIVGLAVLIVTTVRGLTLWLTHLAAGARAGVGLVGRHI